MDKKTQVLLTNSSYSLGELLRSAREHAGLTQVQLADILQTGQQVISNWERDVNWPSLDNFVEFCMATNTPPYHLLHGELGNPVRVRHMIRQLRKHGKVLR